MQGRRFEVGYLVVQKYIQNIFNLEEYICMEVKENMILGVMVIGAEVLFNYYVVFRSEVFFQSGVLQVGVLISVSVGMLGMMEKKKRGRFRKYGFDGNVTKALSLMSILLLVSLVVGSYLVVKWGRGKVVVSVVKMQFKFDMVFMGKWVCILIILMFKFYRLYVIFSY